MGLRKINNLLPSIYRKRGFCVAFAVLVQALLNFIGLAALVPILALLLNPQEAGQHFFLLERFRELSGVTNANDIAGIVCLSVFCIIVIKNLLNVFLGGFQTKYVNSLYCYYSEKLYESYFKQGFLFIKKSNTTALSHKINGVCYIFAHGIISRFFSIVGDAVLFILIWSALLIYSYTLALLTLLCFVPAGLFYYFIVKKNIARYGKSENEYRRRQARLVSETFKGYIDVLTSNSFSLFLSRFRKNLSQISCFRERTDRILRIPNGVIECAVAGVMIMMVLLSRDDASMKFSLGLFAVASLRLLPAVRNIVTGWVQLKNNSYAIEPIYEMLNFEQQKQESVSKNIPFDHFSHKLEVDTVSYAFIESDGSSLPVIENFSMSFYKGERLGIHGASGIGKTTLFNLLLGFYYPQKGQISIDGVPLCDNNISSWHALTAYVPQEVFIMDGTLAENVAFGRDLCEIDRVKVMDVLKQASLSDFVASLPEGMDTCVGENGCCLSGGQRQRLGIARALYKQAEVLFFDEATSSLDSQTEREITDTIRELFSTDKNKTILMIAHRESSLDFCDRIIKI